jgi:hypothetical protein
MSINLVMSVSGRTHELEMYPPTVFCNGRTSSSANDGQNFTFDNDNASILAPRGELGPPEVKLIPRGKLAPGVKIFCSPHIFTY